MITPFDETFKKLQKNIPEYEAEEEFLNEKIRTAKQKSLPYQEYLKAKEDLETVQDHLRNARAAHLRMMNVRSQNVLEPLVHQGDIVATKSVASAMKTIEAVTRYLGLSELDPKNSLFSLLFVVDDRESCEALPI